MNTDTSNTDTNGPPSPHIEQVKRDLPNFPEEVINLWLTHYADALGWPPSPYGRWPLILEGKPLAHWQSVRWSREDRPLDGSSLTPICQHWISLMIDVYVFRRVNEYSDRHTPEEINDGRQRFEDAMAYLVRHGTLPKPIVVTIHPDGLNITDGNHRVAALVAYQQIRGNPALVPHLGTDSVPPDDRHPMWVGYPP